MFSDGASLASLSPALRFLMGDKNMVAIPALARNYSLFLFPHEESNLGQRLKRPLLYH